MVKPLSSASFAGVTGSLMRVFGLHRMGLNTGPSRRVLGLMTCRRALDYIRQRVDQVDHLERLAEAWPIGGLAGQRGIAGNKDKRDMATGEDVRHRIAR